MNISNCCSAPVIEYEDNDAVCTKCQEHCEAVDEESEEA